MNTNGKLALAVLAGISIGAMGVVAIHAQGQPPKGIVVIAFDSAEKALAWYNTPAYQAIKPIRQGASVSRLFMAEGLPPQPPK